MSASTVSVPNALAGRTHFDASGADVSAELHPSAFTIRNQRDLLRADRWLALTGADDIAGTLFQRNAWVSAAAKVVLDNPGWGEIRMLLGTEAGQPVATLPLCISNRAGCRVGRLLGDPLVQYSDILLRQNTRGQDSLCEALQSVSDVDLFVFRRVRDDANILPVVVKSGGRRISQSEAPYLDLTRYRDFQDFLKSGGKKTRERARMRRRAEQQGTLTFEIAATRERVEVLTRHAIELKRDSLRKRSLPSVTLGNDKWCGVLLDAVLSSDASMKPIVSAILVDGKPAAIEIGFVHGGRYFAFLGAFDPEFERWSPTKLVMEETIRWCFEAGLRVYDLLPPDDLYKYEWTNDAMPVSDWVIVRTLRGELYVNLLERCLRPMAKRAYPTVMSCLRFLGLEQLAVAQK